MDRRKQVVYIAGPYKAEFDRQKKLNIYRAAEVTKKYIMLGYTVVCPHLLYSIFDGEVSEEVIQDMCDEELRRSDIITFMCGWEDSHGACYEHDLALQLDKEIIYEYEE